MFVFVRPSSAVSLFVLSLSLSLAPQAARAASPRLVTLSEALSRAEDASPLIRRARAERDSVAAREVGASLLLPANPVVAGAGGPYREPGVRSVELRLHAEQAIEIGGQRAARRAVVGRAVEAAAWREAGRPCRDPGPRAGRLRRGAAGTRP